MCEDNRNGKKENKQSKDVFDVIRTVHFVDRLYAKLKDEEKYYFLFVSVGKPELKS